MHGAVAIWWEGDMMHTKDRLAYELDRLGLDRMRSKAANGYYDDYLSPLSYPVATLVQELEDIGTAPALALRDRAVNGEFDAAAEEAAAWRASPEGLEFMIRLIGL